MFDKSYLNHSLVIYKNKDNNHNFIDLFCEKCKYFIYFDKNNKNYTCTKEYLNGRYATDLLSCDEMIIKNLLE